MTHEPLVPPERVLREARIGGGDFAAVGDEFLKYFRELAGADETSSVLEIGCGAGRMAVPLTTLLRPPGQYVGFDVVRSSVDWCQQQITARYPHFRFHWFDLQNSSYNPAGRLRADQLRFPVTDASCDLVIATSVFTHLLPRAADHYLAESRRVLRPGGRFFSTWFLWRHDSHTSPEAVKLFPVDRGSYRVGSAEDPEAVVAFDVEALRGRYASLGFGITSESAGNWPRGEHRMPFQDMIVATAEA